MTDQSTQISNLLSCSFCKKPNDKVGYLIIGPDDNRICDLCVYQFCEYLDNPAYIGIQEDDTCCSFCTLGKAEVENIIPASNIGMDGKIADVFICDKCLDTCCEILQEIQETN